MDEGCNNCQYRCDLQRWDYSKVGNGENWKEKIDGFACTAFIDEHIIINMVGIDDGMCEMYNQRKDLK